MPLQGGLARDAIEEAMKEMGGFVAFLEYVSADNGLALFGSQVDVEKLMEKTRETPMLLSLPILLRASLASMSHNPSMPGFSPDTVAGLIGLTQEEYRLGCLSGFAKADECAPIVGKALLKSSGIIGLPWLRTWLEKSVKEEEEDSDDDEA